MKKILKIIGILIGLFVIVIAGYLIYLFASYDRIADNQALKPQNISQQELTTNTEYRAMTYNIGYGSYPPSYSFFMDGGDKSIADSSQSVKANLAGVINTTKSLDPTLAFYQEVDQKGTRSRQVNEVQMLKDQLPSYNNLYGENYHSAYLFYPFTQPIGQAKSGLVTLSHGEITAARRYSLPIETNFNKFFDLDRAFTAAYIPTENDKQLVAINIHFSAYTSDKKIQTAQFNKLFEFISEEYQKGNYVVVAGDYNHDLLGNSPEIFNTTKERRTWTHPFPKEKLPAGFSLPNKDLAKDAVPSARDLNEPYQKGKTYTTLIDGFIVSDNIEVKNLQVEDTEFEYSDHNPVYLDFQLNE
ncbi:endonuclease/exonuclease/phosphatase family protein [Enterococcus alishanensis]